MLTRRIATLGRTILLLSLLLAAGCGQKGPVRPLLQKRPAAVEAAVLLQRGAAFQIQWKFPQKNLDGTAITDIDFVEIRHLFSGEGEFCAECPTPWPLFAKINPQLPAPARHVNRNYLLSDASAPLGLDARYRLTAVNQEGIRGLPTLLKQRLRPALLAPEGLTLTPHDRSVSVTWQASPVPSGATLLGYRIYRRQGNQPFPPLSINRKPLKNLSFADFSLENGRIYSYRVRSLFRFGQDLVESLPSAERPVTPHAG